ncbi:5-formyltetrahydrofolate cyclo-ligase [Pseudobutyrivibrio sp. JW11]|uniref:5-formyltetrahydrofolate cyclo-ligase n=1 Tax=Pseudobutyrivibrio sp. JW11 TaxID=1855302 RepID=UPI0008EFEE34|nr:5-formyltetrahydrofolate cyclo-ligase [Pseudobutyrivibrio sp. JW11]SFN98970.1 5-formyltetrahydrofolate cyclo-ligase [Pseudobutyrivibrio sp. JW11]
MEVSQTSNDIRLTYKSIRDGISISERNRLSSLISENVLALLESDFKGANIFLCYYSFGSEVNLKQLYSILLQQGKHLYFPKCDKKNHQLYFYEIVDLEKDFSIGSYNIMEPKSDMNLLTDFNQSIISITPGLIFDKKLNRIGYGGGFYDRFFEKHPKITSIAPCFSKQLAENIQIESHDIPMDCIVTENLVLKGSRS